MAKIAQHMVTKILQDAAKTMTMKTGVNGDDTVDASNGAKKKKKKKTKKKKKKKKNTVS